MYTDIFLEDKFPGYEVGPNSINILKKLSKINIFIGENNSGKSRLLRSLFASDIRFIPKELDWTAVQTSLQNIRQNTQEQFFYQGMADVNNILNTLDKFLRRTSFASSEIANEITELNTFLESLSKTETFSGAHLPNSNGSPDVTLILNYIRGLENKATNITSTLPKGNDFSTLKLYIPILRGTKPIQIAGSDKNYFHHDDNYKYRTIKDYFKDKLTIKNNDTDNEHIIFTGLNLYDETKNMLLGKREKREKIKKFENFLSSTFFNKEPVSLIPHSDDDVLYIGIGGDERPIYEYGDGIQSLIIILYPLFINQGQRLIAFIEEPELSLHPGMQRILLEALLKPEFNSYQYFISTHSNHFLDITLDVKDISVYTFNKKVSPTTSTSNFLIENVSNKDIKTLDLIGVRNSSLFLSNCTIWVEGITDRLYLRKYLDVYQNSLISANGIKSKYLEDLHFSFIEFQGTNLTHWSFVDEESWEKIKATSISKKIFILADQDTTESNPNSKKAARYKLLSEHLGNNFRVLKCTEIENTLAENIIEATISEIEGKSKSLKAGLSLAYSDYKNKKIGTYIDNVFENLGARYGTENGSLKNKLNFCKVATGLIKTVDDLSEEALNLAKEIFEFVKRSNA
jgi:AAA15 family ATPase/GTPase